MKLATIRGNSRDGRLVVVSRDLRTAVIVEAICPTLLAAVEQWDHVEPRIREVYDGLNEHTVNGAFAFDPDVAMAPLPRAPQWCDASAFLNHGRLMERAFNTQPIPLFDSVPVMYQGASDDFLGPRDDVMLPDEGLGIDFEGEFGVIVGDVPMGCSASEAQSFVRLVVQINDWSLRGLGPHEMKTGFGFLQAKPSSSFAPVAITLDELGHAWSNSRVHLRLHVEWNGERFGEPYGGEMNFGFDQLIAHASRTRRLRAGTVIGSGTVSNAERSAGSTCIAERRVIELIENGEVATPFMRFGDRVTMRARNEFGNEPFGAIDQRVVGVKTDAIKERL